MPTNLGGREVYPLGNWNVLFKSHLPMRTPALLGQSTFLLVNAKLATRSSGALAGGRRPVNMKRAKLPCATSSTFFLLCARSFLKFRMFRKSVGVVSGRFVVQCSVTFSYHKYDSSSSSMAASSAFLSPSSISAKFAAILSLRYSPADFVSKSVVSPTCTLAPGSSDLLHLFSRKSGCTRNLGKGWSRRLPHSFFLKFQALATTSNEVAIALRNGDTHTSSTSSVRNFNISGFCLDMYSMRSMACPSPFGVKTPSQ
mmetsp:Transcript_27043/g.62510  ORF Transcript_27043/g.62510 Transcript_27043/m.62510 type:complete len:256 (+) Transcript_27043:588-1355(+)